MNRYLERSRIARDRKAEVRRLWSERDATGPQWSGGKGFRAATFGYSAEFSTDVSAHVAALSVSRRPP